MRVEKGNLCNQEPGSWLKRYILVLVQHISIGLIEAMSYATFLVFHNKVKDGIVCATSDTSQKGMKVATSSLGSRAREETMVAKRVQTTNPHQFPLAQQ